MPSLVVTGGTGLLGHGIKSSIANVFGENAEGWEFHWLSSKECDLRDSEQTRSCFNKYKPTHVVHLAARVGGLFANMEDQVGFFRDNIRINESVLMNCHEFKVQRAVFCLSTCIFPAEAKLPLTEDSIHTGPPHFSNEGYAMAKRMLECNTRWYREKFGYDWICVAPTNLYGPHDNFNLKDAHVIPALMHKCYLADADRKPFEVAGSGKPLRQFLFAADCGAIILRLLALPAERLPSQTTFILTATDEEYTIADVVHKLVGAMNFKGDVVFDTSKADGIFKKTASNAKLLELFPNLQFTPLAKGLIETANWFRENFENFNIRR